MTLCMLDNLLQAMAGDKRPDNSLRVELWLSPTILIGRFTQLVKVYEVTDWPNISGWLGVKCKRQTWSGIRHSEHLMQNILDCFHVCLSAVYTSYSPLPRVAGERFAPEDCFDCCLCPVTIIMLNTECQIALYLAMIFSGRCWLMLHCSWNMPVHKWPET